MNETILNGLLNLFAVFASAVRIEEQQASRAVHFYLSSHFGVRSHKEYIELYSELRSMYDDPLFPVDKENVIRNICEQMKVKLVAEEQLLLLVRFVEFAYSNSEEFENHLPLFHLVADIFAIPQEEFDDILAFITGKPSSSLLTISGEEAAIGNHITRKGMDGFIRVLFIRRFDKQIFTYYGSGVVFMNDIPLSPGIFYAWQHSSVLKGPLFLPVYYSDLLTVYNKNERKEAIFLNGRDLNFTFKNSTNGLHNFSFNLESGQLVAIMGGSGVGKSTLLGIMNGNIRPDEGTITVNGYPLDAPEARQLIGFVPQDDLLIEELTVYQNLWFTARLCFARLSDQEIKARVENVLKELDLEGIKDLEVGSPIRKTISGGQRKRLNIALELIREPAILYLDEPTSGLSSSDSEKVIMLLKEQTHRGKLVVVNIHQPSSEIYKLFDRLWLLDRGGYPIYDGNPIEAIIYFKQAAKYTDPDISVCSTCGNVNPELILNIIDSKKIDDSGNQTNIRKFTPEEWHEKYISSRPSYTPVEEKELPDSKQKKPTWFKQFCIFLERNIRTKLVNKQYLAITLLEAPLLALIVALLTRYVDGDEYTLLANKNFVSYIFMSVIVVTFMGLSISAEEIIKDRPVLKREHFLRLSRSSYLTSKMVYLLGVSGFQSLLFILVGNTIIGVGWEMFGVWWSILWITSFLANLTGLILSQSMNSVVAIYITIPLLLIPQILLCGLVIKFDDLNTSASKENKVPLIGDIIPSRWAFEALMVEQFADNAYNQAYFPIEREKYLAQYYENIHSKEVRRLAEQLEGKDDPDKRLTVENELAVLGRAARIAPRSEGESFLSYLDKVDSALHERARNFTAYLDQIQEKDIREKGSEWVTEQKKKYHNSAIEDLVMGAGSRNFYKEHGNRIYPAVGQIYIVPDNPFGRAPFYSYEKKLGSMLISTYNFNLLIIGFFALLAIIAIFAEFPGRLKEE
ncbi:ATP-binding cassette domain-containing protein [Parabacteroides sp. BX2]|jgi:ABC transport system ATP-binding/permease protein|uniref:ATP-binding cassette domain-containing protein n=1 Tax=Parabacteroides segnis TaxID=2763058 RepID=A0ABR7E9B0_9BACT|nr:MULTISPECIES: ATP-binding cassette domain-containing protein [Parabacteroides]MBC5645733.1 ATP-binding cassette domain-containing protein [Parabacteroides segnis]MCM0715508.1 ATP-binding cassette domain-containing protein [Parabacteroides sp. TA-V-105]